MLHANKKSWKQLFSIFSRRIYSWGRYFAKWNCWIRAKLTFFFFFFFLICFYLTMNKRRWIILPCTYVYSMIIEINAVHSFTEINLLSITFNCDIMTSHILKQQFIVKIYGNILLPTRFFELQKVFFFGDAIRLYLIVGFFLFFSFLFFLFFFFCVQDTKQM